MLLTMYIVSISMYLNLMYYLCNAVQHIIYQTNENSKYWVNLAVEPIENVDPKSITTPDELKN